MKNLIIAGAGNFGREVAAWAKQSIENEPVFHLKGFVDDEIDGRKSSIHGVPVLAKIVDYKPEREDIFVCAVGDPGGKRIVCESLAERGAVFTNVIHPTVILGENIRMGTGNILCPYTVVSCDAALGDHVSINLHCSIGHDVVLEDYCQISPHVSIGGGAVIEEGVNVGSNVAVLPLARVGAGAVVGAGSVVLKNAPAGKTVFGVPAKPLPLPDRKK